MLAIIDGDVLAYQACESRWEKTAVVQNNTNIIRLDENGKRIPLEFTQEEDAEYMELAWGNFKRNLGTLLESVYCEHYLMAVKGSDNFRNMLYPEYKLHRHSDPTKQNMFVPIIRHRAVKEGYAIAADGREADDLLRIWSEQARKAGEDYIICTIDKDLKCIPGKFWNMKYRTLENITEAAAIRHYYYQLLKGDPTDNIPGVPRVGEVKANKILAPFDTEEEFQEQVIEQYMLAYGDDWRDFLLSNAKMIHLQKHPDDYFSFNDWPIINEL